MRFEMKSVMLCMLQLSMQVLGVVVPVSVIRAPVLASPLQHQALGRLGRLLVAVGFQDPNRCFRVALLVRVLHEGF